VHLETRVSKVAPDLLAVLVSRASEVCRVTRASLVQQDQSGWVVSWERRGHLEIPVGLEASVILETVERQALEVSRGHEVRVVSLDSRVIREDRDSKEFLDLPDHLAVLDSQARPVLRVILDLLGLPE